MTVSAAQLAQEWGWIKQYFPASAWCTAYGVMLRESGGDPEATNESGIERSYGLFQVNVNAHPDVSKAQLYDPEFNVRYAGGLYASQGWQPWKSQAEYDGNLPAASTVTPVCGPGGGSIASVNPKTLILLAVVAVIVLDELG